MLIVKPLYHVWDRVLFFSFSFGSLGMIDTLVAFRETSRGEDMS